MVDCPGVILLRAAVQSGLNAVVVFEPPVAAMSRVLCRLDVIV